MDSLQYFLNPMKLNWNIEDSTESTQKCSKNAETPVNAETFY